MYAESYGFQGKYNYGLPPGECSIAAFDIRVKVHGGYVDVDMFLDMTKEFGIPVVPTVYRGPWSHNKMLELVENTPNLLGGNHEAEGIVIKPVVEKLNRKYERLMYKLISSKYNG